MPTALITGITGQDGGYLAEQLVGQGWHVHGALRFGEAVPPHLAVLGKSIAYTEVDLLDPSSVRSLLDVADPDEVYNFAGVSSVAQSWVDPVTTSRINGEVVALLLDTVWTRCQKGRNVRFLQASSAEIFAGATTSPQNENTQVCPRTPYGASKAYAHHLTQVYRNRGLHGVNAILYNHESPRRPPTFVTRKITRAVAAIADGREARLILGTLDSRRDWGWAPEYVQAMTAALRYVEPNDWVLATGVSTSVKEFVRMAFASVGISDWESYVEKDPTFVRSGDAPELMGNSLRAERLLGWRPLIPLSDIVGRMVEADLAVLRKTNAREA